MIILLKDAKNLKRKPLSVTRIEKVC